MSRKLTRTKLTKHQARVLAALLSLHAADTGPRLIDAAAGFHNGRRFCTTPSGLVFGMDVANPGWRLAAAPLGLSWAALGNAFGVRTLVLIRGPSPAPEAAG